jgi:hypothetical protein
MLGTDEFGCGDSGRRFPEGISRGMALAVGLDFTLEMSDNLGDDRIKQS